MIIANRTIQFYNNKQADSRLLLKESKPGEYFNQIIDGADGDLLRHDIITVLHVTFWSSCAIPGLVTRDTATQSHSGQLEYPDWSLPRAVGMVKKSGFNITLNTEHCVAMSTSASAKNTLI